MPAAGGRAELDMLVCDGHITGLVPPGTGPAAGTTVDARGCLVVPGLVDAHTHSYAQLCSWAVADGTLESWLPAAAVSGAGMTAEAAATAAQLSAIDALRHGATTTLDHAVLAPGHAEAMVHAYTEVGARAAVAAQVADVSFADSLHGVAGGVRDAVRAADTRATSTAAAQLELCRELLAAASGAPLLTVLVGPSAPERCTPSLLDGVRELADETGAALHVHLLETQQQRAGGDPLGTLARHGLVRDDLSLAHCVHLDDADVERIATAGAAVVHNPLSNLGLGSGRLDLRRLLAAGVTVGLGCDSWTTGGAQDVLAQARLALVNSRPEHAAAAWLKADEVWALAGVGGAHAIRLPEGTGELTPGAPADLLIVDAPAASLVDGIDPVVQLVLGGFGAGLREVWVAGRPVMRDGLPLHVDAERLLARAAELLPALRAAAAPLEPLAARLRALLETASPSPVHA